MVTGTIVTGTIVTVTIVTVAIVIIVLLLAQGDNLVEGCSNPICKCVCIGS